MSLKERMKRVERELDTYASSGVPSHLLNHGQERFISPAVAGRMLGVTDKTVKRWVEQGKLQAYRPGRAYQIVRSSVESLMADSEAQSEAASSGFATLVKAHGWQYFYRR